MENGGIERDVSFECSSGSTGGQRNDPPRNFLGPFVGTSLVRHNILSILFIVNIFKLGRCTRSKQYTSRLLLYFNLYKTSL